MDRSTVVIIVVILVLALVAAAAAMLYQRRRSAQLQERFGPEYKRTVHESDDRRAAEKDLAQREKRRSEFEIKPLTGKSVDDYREEWKHLQGRFVDEPGPAVAQADRLVVRIMRESGYPVDDFDRRADDISVDHPEVVQNYHEAHDIAVAESQGQASTEQLRQAVTSYRRLVDALLPGHERQEHEGGRSSGPSDTREQT